MNVGECAPDQPAVNAPLACVSTRARPGIVRECLAALERHGVELRWLSIFRDEHRPGHLVVSVVSGSGSGLATALDEIAGAGTSEPLGLPRRSWVNEGIRIGRSARVNPAARREFASDTTVSTNGSESRASSPSDDRRDKPGGS